MKGIQRPHSLHFNPAHSGRKHREWATFRARKLLFGQSYVLAVDAQPAPAAKEKIRYSLRSCHHSLYPLVLRIDEKTEVRHTAVKLNRNSTKDPVYLPLEKFLEQTTKATGR